MRILKPLVINNYREHPAFNFGVPSWEVPDEKLAVFNRRYLAARQFSSTLDAASRRSLRYDLLQALGSVFACLQVQVENEYESCFLLELENACTRLLEEEMQWHARPRLVGFVNLIGERARQHALKMQQDSHFFDFLPDVVVKELRILAQKELQQFRTNASEGRLTREDLSVNTGSTVRAIRSVLNREFKKFGVLDAVSAFAGRKIRVVGLALELSVPQATWWRNAIDGLNQPPETLYAHMDESISLPKAIVYLSDVSEQNGPTGCYPGAYEALQLNPLQEIMGRVIGIVGSLPKSTLKDYYGKQYHQSVNSENFRRHFMRLPESLRFNSHMGWDVLPCSELESELVLNERKMIGSAGSFIVFDGAHLMHRGGLVLEGERLVLQVIFSDIPLIERAIGRIKRILS